MIFILSTTKKLSEISFCPRFEIYVLIVSTLVFAFEIIRPFTFCTVKKVSFPQSRMFSTLKELSHIQVTISYSNNFSAFKELFHIQGTFLHSRNFSTIKTNFHIQETFLQSKRFSKSSNFRPN